METLVEEMGDQRGGVEFPVTSFMDGPQHKSKITRIQSMLTSCRDNSERLSNQVWEATDLSISEENLIS